MEQEKNLYTNKENTLSFPKEWETPMLKILNLSRTENGDSASSSESFFAFIFGVGGS